jgi:hypothetical protein
VPGNNRLQLQARLQGSATAVLHLLLAGAQGSPSLRQGGAQAHGPALDQRCQVRPAADGRGLLAGTGHTHTTQQAQAQLGWSHPIC